VGMIWLEGGIIPRILICHGWAGFGYAQTHAVRVMLDT
jgi:hypothetical protein